MKNLTLSLIAIVVISTSAIAETYPAYGPDSYKAIHDSGNIYGVATDVEGVTRKGFRFGLGIGGANTHIDNYYLNNDNYSETGFATTGEIGYAPNNQFSINYMGNGNWGSGDGRSSFLALAFNYYIDNAVESLYLVGGIGGARYDFSDTYYDYSYGDFMDDYEVAGILGIGYAMDKVEFEVDAVFSKHNDRDMRQFFFTISYMFY